MATLQFDRSAVTARRRLLIAQVKQTTANVAGQAWSSMRWHGPDAQPDFARVARPAIIAGQSRAIDLTVAALAATLAIKPQLDRQAILDDAQVDLTEPFLAFGQALNDDLSIEDALAAGLDRAMSIAADGVQWAARNSGSAFDYSDRVTGWERVPDGAACNWCIEVAGQVYKTADTASFGHSNCGCDVEPLTDDAPASGYEASAAAYAARTGG